ncbi:sulfonate transport system permease protein [Pseudonocardia thermophila]|uniref:Sulfonate transport system permease protein n=1 Tax=Pseudonocardia thermophila TaxID=1848 RepID=A0A1M6PF84_PSETH|nr:ABC transporter permease [Pseudonocardia thermophila]SHK06606.1 sulfonate transport system permease protein [Pseudonocardia thermophila]
MTLAEPQVRPVAPAAPPAARRGRRVVTRAALGLVVPALLVVVWHLAATSGEFSPSQLPTPGAVLAALLELIGRGELWRHIAISVQRVLIGFAVGGGVGLVLGGVIGLSAPLRALLAPTIQALRAVPSLAWVPLLLLWLGIGETPKITLVAIGAFFPVYTTVSAALAHVDHRLVEVGRAYGRSGVRLFLQVQLPAIAPGALSGIRLGLAQGWLFLVAAELIASSIGLGFLLIDSQNTGRTDILLLAIVLLALLGKATDGLLGLAERRLLRRWT